MNLRNKKQKLFILDYISGLTLIKIIVSMLLVVIPNVMFHNLGHGILEIIELIIIYFLVMIIGKSLRIVGYLLSSVLTLLVIAEEWVKLFSGTYATKVMLDNLANIRALGPSLPKYIAIVIFVVLVSFIPIKFKKYPRPLSRVILLVLSTVFFGGVYFTHRLTALGGVTNLLQEYRMAHKTAIALEEERKNKKKVIKSFQKDTIKGGINIGKKKPNVIVIFAEGTSRTVIEQTANKYPGLMPNVESFSKQSINFTNYFNHTAPTYRGLRGQLSSSFQYFEGYEKSKTADDIKKRVDTPIITLPEILRDHGYASQFINPEPKHKKFTPYLNELGFDKVISGNKTQWSGQGQSTVLSDTNNFNLLFSTATKLNNSQKPFLLGTYTFQTHNGWNVTDNPYKDGNNAVLNKFHNFDVNFGKFLKKFNESNLKDNTILILTTDHASYASPDYASVMGDTRDAFASTIPLMIYYPGVQPETVDVKGRNSLGLTPTILDLLNIDKAKNYFLGTSLFTDSPSKYEHATEVGEDFYDTSSGNLTEFTDSQINLKDKILQFDSFSLNMK